MSPIVAFITGLTAGGLSCLAVQAGLLATSMGDQAKDDIEEELRHTQPKIKLHPELIARGPEFTRHLRRLQKKRLSNKKYTRALQVLRSRYPKTYSVPNDEAPAEQPKRHMVRPVVLFLTARLIAYTALGFLLGWVGTALQLTPYARAALLIIVGVFMFGTAMRMLNVHPIFRHFTIEPPKSLTRYMRRKAKKDGAHTFTPIMLGALTVLIPCGITQVMMAAAIASGNPLTGASIMFAFILGTSPIFFGLAYMTTKLTGRLQAGFLKFVGVVILVLSLLSINGGLNLAGSPLSFTNLKQSVSDKFASANTVPVAEEAAPTAPQLEPTLSTAPTTAPTAQVAPAEESSSNLLKLTASSESYRPAVIKASTNKPYKLEITSKENRGCGRAFTIPSLNKQEILPEDGVTTIDLPAQKPGKLRMTCAMGMYNAVIEFK